MIETKEALFWFCALAGSGMFILQFFLVFLGGGEDGDLSDGHFKWLSKQAVSGFLMMFGWVGLACRMELGLGTIASTSGAAAAGLLAMFVSGAIFKTARKLKSTGTVFRIEEAVGKEATVYQRIPSIGAGKISLSLQGIGHEIDAVSIQGEEIDSFTQVEIVKIIDERTVAVISLK
jgi:hypothetical protein